MVRDKFVSVPVFSRKSRIRRWNKFVVRRRLLQICLSVFPATRARITMLSSLVNVGSGRDFTTGRGTRTLDGNFIGLRTFSGGRWRGQFSLVWKLFSYIGAAHIRGSRAQRQAPELGTYKHVDGNANSANVCVQNCTLFIWSCLIRHINP